MKSFIRNIFRFAGTVAVSALFLGLSACKQPPSPPYRADGSAIEIEYASFYWKKEDDFKRISEFFTGEENRGSHVIVRSNPEERAGLYLIVNLEPFTTIPAGSIAELRYFHPEKPEEQISRWELPEFNALPHRELRLGLTGKDWAASISRKRPSAWKLTIFAPDGKTQLVRRESYLWSERTR